MVQMRHGYATKSNQHRVVKTLDGKLVYQTTKKRASGPKCIVNEKRVHKGDSMFMAHKVPEIKVT